MKNTKGDTLCPFVERFTIPEAILYTDEYDSYNRLQRVRHTVCHSKNEWARDDDGDGIREVHVNSNEGVGLVYEISYDPIVGFTKPTYPAMLPFMNWLSITSLFLLN